MDEKIDYESTTPNKDNDKLFRDTIKPKKKEDGTYEESTESSGKLEYFTD